MNEVPREQPLPPSDRHGFVEASDGTKIFYELFGRGPAVVLSDGILCEGFVWKYLLPKLSKKYTVVHWHYRGHGRSGRPKASEHIGVKNHADDLWRVLDGLGIERAALAGHSMGTQVSLEGFRAHPTRTAGLLLICGSYGRVTRTFHGTDALAKLLPVALGFYEQYPKLFRALLSRTPGRLAVEFARLSREIDPIRTRTEDMLPYFEHFAGLDPGLALRMVEAAGKHSAEDILHAITAPTLVIAGERDSFTPPRLARQMADQIPNAEYLFVPDGSHSCSIEQPELVDGRIERFLTERVYL